MIYRTLWKMGYHLRRCSFCNRRRIYKRVDPSRPHPDDLTAEELTESFNRRIARTLRNENMAKGKTGVKMGSNPTEEAIEPQQQTAPASHTISVAVADDDEEDYRICTRCGGGVYRRSRRTWLERMMKRPRMARCMKCNHRFPYPRHRD